MTISVTQPSSQSAHTPRGDQCGNSTGEEHPPRPSEHPAPVVGNERLRLFALISELVTWVNTTNEQVLDRAWAEIRRQLRQELPRALAYRLYNHCEKTKQAEEARSYNGLVIAWPELEKRAAPSSDAAAGPQQLSMV